MMNDNGSAAWSEDGDRGNTVPQIQPGEPPRDAGRPGINAADVASRLRQIVGDPRPRGQDEDDSPSAAELAATRRRQMAMQADAHAGANILPVHLNDSTGWAPPYAWDPAQDTSGYLPSIFTHPMFANGLTHAAAPMDMPLAREYYAMSSGTPLVHEPALEQPRHGPG